MQSAFSKARAHILKNGKSGVNSRGNGDDRQTLSESSGAVASRAHIKPSFPYGNHYVAA